MIVACIGYFVLDIFVDGVFQDPFAKTVVYIFERIGMDELEAIRVYRLIFVQNKTMIIGAGFFVLLLLSFYLGMSKFTTYLRQVEGGIQMILNESKDRILLPPELNPLENKLNEIKGTLKEQRRIAEESEQRKNDIENNKSTVVSTLQTKTDIPQNNEKEQKLKTERNEKPGKTRMPCAYVDGSYNKYKKIYGYGGIFFDGEQTHTMHGHGNEPDMVSMRNVAGKIEGAMAAIRYAKEHDIKEFIMYYDYSGIEQWATGRWSANKTGTQKYQKYVQECGIKIHFKKIKGHSGNTGNEIADNLAKQAAGITDRGYR